jgi:hypothetical protein
MPLLRLIVNSDRYSEEERAQQLILRTKEIGHPMP